MARKDVFAFVLLLTSCWRSLGESENSQKNPPCDSKVFGGTLFSQFVAEKRCVVDEKLSLLFTDDDSFKSMVNKTAGNVMCIGFIEVFNMASKDSCTYGSLGRIPSEDFCNNGKLLDVLAQANDSDVFDEHHEVVKVVDFILQYCDYMCSDSTGSSELCWAFGEYVRIVMIHHTATISTESPSTQPTTTTTPTPDFEDFLSKTFGTKQQQDTPNVSDIGDNQEGKEVGNNSDGNDNAYINDKDENNDKGTDNEKPKVYNNLDSASKSAINQETDGPSDMISTTLPGETISNETGDTPVDGGFHQPITNEKQPSDSTLPVQTTAQSNEEPSAQSNEEPSAQSNEEPSAQSNEEPSATLVDHTPDDQNNKPSDGTTSESSNENIVGLPSNDTDDSSGESNIIDDDPSRFELNHGNQVNNDGDTTLGTDTENQNTGHGAIKDGASTGNDKPDVHYEYDDDDDDDGYSYWHFAAVLLFILFLGVGIYLASLNRKKIRESVSTYMNKRKRRKEYKPVNTMEAGLS